MTDYVIIGGSTKCATTSLFNYLSDHPDICPCRFKESRFFLHVDYPLERKVPLSDSILDYNSLFNHCETNDIKLEATPDYLYSKDTELKIKDMLSNYKLVFILRNPADRLVSWYNFSKQVHLLNSNVSFEKYINDQLENSTDRSQHYLALEQGKYINYLRKYYGVISKENIHVIIYEDLIQNPRNVIMKLCAMLDIDSTIYDNYQFDVFNPTVNIKNKTAHKVFLRSKRLIRKSLRNVPFNFLTNLKSKSKPLQNYYLKKNTEELNQIKVSENVQSILNNYYSQSNKQLEEMLQRKVNW